MHVVSGYHSEYFSYGRRVIHVRIALCGSDGKMGQVFLAYFKDQYSILEVTKSKNCLNDVIEEVDLVVDFTNAIGAFVHGVIALTHDVPIIIGSTGMKDKQKETLKKIANRRNIACVVCDNFSYGILWLKQVLPDLYPYFTHMRIEEAHHRSKKDAPSGTAKAFKENLKMECDPIVSIRDDDLSVRHCICIDNEFESLCFEHVVKDRRAYMEKLKECIQTMDSLHQYRDFSDFFKK